jgi:hypothetical protein
MNKLDEAKINLKKTIERLEKVVEAKLIVSKNSPAVEVMNKMKTLQDDMSKLTTDLDDKKDEITYLREQNAELQAKVGEEQQKAFQMEAKNRETANRIDVVMLKLQSYLSEKRA